MRAAVLRRTGGPEVLGYEKVPTPTVAPGEVLIAVESVSVNQTLDLQIRSGASRRGVQLPHVLGVDPAGNVAEVGEGVDRLAPDDRVVVTSAIWCGKCEACTIGEQEDCSSTAHIGVHRWGGYAEYVVVPEANVHQIPASLAFDEASVIMRHAPTARNLLKTKAELSAGETVLAMGASGGLGSIGVQLAKLLGATVIAGAGTGERVTAALALGADYGVAYRQEPLAERVLDLTNGRGVDVVFENVGDPALWADVMASMARRARLVTAGAHGGGRVDVDLHRLYRQRLRLIGGAGHRETDIDRSLELAADGQLRANIATHLPLSHAAQAHRLAERRAVNGKIVLLPTERDRT